MANDGGSAFPIVTEGGILAVLNEGMSLRDWFAGQALAGGLLETAIESNTKETQKIAEAAYEIADAMLEMRGRHS